MGGHVSKTGFESLDFTIEQVWGSAIARGDADVVMSGAVPTGWEVRERYWLVPAAATAQLIVPRHPRIASRALADFAGLRTPRVRVIRRSLALAARGGFPLGRDTLSIVTPVGAPPTVVAELGAALGAEKAFATLGLRAAANAKPTLDLRNDRGEALGFAKLAWNATTRRAVSNESSALTTLAPRSSGVIVHPRLMLVGQIAGREVVVTEPLPRSIRAVSATAHSLSVGESLGPAEVRRRGTLSSSSQVRSIIDVLSAAAERVPAPVAGHAYDLARMIAAASTVLPIADFWHGDFVWWNTGRAPDGSLWLFDWETAEADAPAGLDTIHWFAHVKDHLNPHSVVPRIADAVERSEPALRSLGHSRSSANVVAAWYAVVLVAGEIRLADELGSWERVKHPPEVLREVLEWARAAMEAAC